MREISNVDDYGSPFLSKFCTFAFLRIYRFGEHQFIISSSVQTVDTVIAPRLGDDVGTLDSVSELLNITSTRDTLSRSLLYDSIDVSFT